ncbi:MAG: hypothetical protein PVH62_07680, partial [Anaerolineae bacterium]
MKRREFLGERVPAAVFASWRGRPLYILMIYLFGQLIINPPNFLIAVLFVSLTTQSELAEFISAGGIGVAA